MKGNNLALYLSTGGEFPAESRMVAPHSESAGRLRSVPPAPHVGKELGYPQSPESALGLNTLDQVEGRVWSTGSHVRFPGREPGNN